MHHSLCPYCQSSLSGRQSRVFLRCDTCGFLFPRPEFTGPTDVEEIPNIPGYRPGLILNERYWIRSTLGSGANGVTFLAEHILLKHPCVIKVLHRRATSSDSREVQRLKTEAASGFRINHPNVVRVLDGNTSDDAWYIVMEFVPGCTLDDFRRDRMRPSSDQLLRLATDAASGLAAIHATGLVHRDLRPTNLLLSQDGSLRIADLGIGALAGGLDAGDSAVGDPSLAYLPPEALEPDYVPDTLGDLYALGASLFEVATGDRLRVEGGFGALLGTQFRNPEWPRDLETPRWLADAILKLVAVDPEQRFQRANHFLETVRAQGVKKSTAAPACEPTRLPATGVVVPVFLNAGGRESDDWLGHVLAEQLARGLAAVPGMLVADREEYARLTERLRCTRARASSAAREAATFLGVSSVIVGSFMLVGERVHVEAIIQRETEFLELGALEAATSDLSRLQTDLERRVRMQLGVALEEISPAATGGYVPLIDAQQKCFDARRCYFAGDYEAAIGLATAAIEVDSHFGEALGLVGACCAKCGRYDEAVSWHERQQRLARDTHDDRLGVEALANLGAMHYFRGDYESAHRFFTQAAQSAERLGFSAELAKISNNLGFVLFQLDRIDEARDAYQRAIKSHVQNRVLTSLIGPYNGMGNVLCAKKEFEGALKYYRDALKLAQDSEDRVNEGIGFTYLGRCEALQGRFSDAKNDLAMALNILERTRFWNGLARAYESSCEMHIRCGDWAEALRCADNRIALARQHGNQRMEESAWTQRLAVLEQSGREREAAVCRAEIERLRPPTWQAPSCTAALAGSAAS